MGQDRDTTHLSNLDREGILDRQPLAPRTEARRRPLDSANRRETGCVALSA